MKLNMVGMYMNMTDNILVKDPQMFLLIPYHCYNCVSKKKLTLHYIMGIVGS